MAHFSKIDENGKVLDVVVVDDSQEHRGQDFLAKDLKFEGTWIKTSYNTRFGKHILGGTPFRKNYGGVGTTYDPQRDAFILPKPENHPSFILNEETCAWIPPFPPPDDGKYYRWDESTISWIEVPKKI